jgi:hypothetical protein
MAALLYLADARNRDKPDPAVSAILLEDNAAYWYLYLVQREAFRRDGALATGRKSRGVGSDRVAARDGAPQRRFWSEAYCQW